MKQYNGKLWRKCEASESIVPTTKLHDNSFHTLELKNSLNWEIAEKKVQFLASSFLRKSKTIGIWWSDLVCHLLGIVLTTHDRLPWKCNVSMNTAPTWFTFPLFLSSIISFLEIFCLRHAARQLPSSRIWMNSSFYTDMSIQRVNMNKTDDTGSWSEAGNFSGNKGLFFLPLVPKN